MVIPPMLIMKELWEHSRARWKCSKRREHQSGTDVVMMLHCMFTEG